jgi:hypothetical protein
MVARFIISAGLLVGGPAMAVEVLALPVPKSLSALCPKAAKPGEIVVCADGEPTPSPYRAPFKPGPVVGDKNSISVSRERNALVEMGMDGGGGSCSASGAMGMYGCQFREHMRWVEQSANSKDKRGRIFEGTEK